LLGFEVDLLAYPIGQDQQLQGVRILRSPNPLGIRSAPIGFSMRKLVLDLGMLWSFRRLLRQENYVAVHAVEEMAFAAVVMGAGRCPVIYDMQSSLPHQLHRHAVFGVGPLQWLLRRLEQWLLTHADAIVCSAGLKDYVLAIHPAAHVTELLYMSVAAWADPLLSAQWRADVGLPDAARVILYSGTFEPYQGLDLLVEAMPRVLEKHPDALFVLVGATDDRPLEGTSISRALLESRQLRILPRVERHAIPSLLAAAEVLVSPRCYGDNIPLKIFDYMAVGRPIVATDIKAHRAVLDERSALLVDVSAEGLASGICRALDDPAFASTLGREARYLAGRGRAGASFDRLVAEVYASVCRVPTQEGQTGRRFGA
jgi:glycosyltransferase involved in cell wall biosynthesis